MFEIFNFEKVEDCIKLQLSRQSARRGPWCSSPSYQDGSWILCSKMTSGFKIKKGMGNTNAPDETRKRRVSDTDWDNLPSNEVTLMEALTEKLYKWLSYVGEELSAESTGTTFCSRTIDQSSYIQQRMLASFGQCTQAMFLFDMCR